MYDSLFIGWGPAIHGREQKSLQVFQEALEFFGKKQQEGEIQSFEPFALEPHGGELAGFLLVRGDPEKLSRLRGSEEFVTLIGRAQLVVQDFGVVGGFTGETLQRLFADFARNAQELA